MVQSLESFICLSIHRILGCTATPPPPPMSRFYLIPESAVRADLDLFTFLFVYVNVCMYVCMCYFSVILVLF